MEGDNKIRYCWSHLKAKKEVSFWTPSPFLCAPPLIRLFLFVNLLILLINSWFFSMTRPKVFRLAAMVRINVESRLSDIILNYPAICLPWWWFRIPTSPIRRLRRLRFYRIFFNFTNIRIEELEEKIYPPKVTSLLALYDVSKNCFSPIFCTN